MNDQITDNQTISEDWIKALPDEKLLNIYVEQTISEIEVANNKTKKDLQLMYNEILRRMGPFQ